MKLWFGKHKDEDISAIPQSYLVWLEEQDQTSASLRDAINFELDRRRGNRPGAGRVVVPGTHRKGWGKRD